MGYFIVSHAITATSEAGGLPAPVGELAEREALLAHLMEQTKL
jgi:hypothetical protein